MLKSRYPEIEHLSRVFGGDAYSLMTGSSKVKKSGYFVDPDFLQMFTFPVTGGDGQTALNDPRSIVLTESSAKALFGAQNPIGRTVRMNNQYDVKVTAVIEDVPQNSSITFDFLMPFAFQLQNSGWIQQYKNQWGFNFLANIVEIKQGVSMAAFSSKIGPLVKQLTGQSDKETLFLHPLAKWRLYDDYKDWVNAGGRIKYVRLFGIVGLFVLLIACINFMNLSTANSGKRAREVGIRKTVGSLRSQLMAQFFTESVLTSFLAFLLSLLLIELSLPYLRDLGFGHIRFRAGDIPLWAALLALSVVTGLVAGSYPALYLSSFIPVKVLKGLVRQGHGPARFRKIMVVSQFVISIGLIVSTVIVFEQIDHARNRAIGYDPDNLVTVDASQDLLKNFTTLQQDLLNTGYVEAVTRSSSPMTNINNDLADFTWQGKDPNANISFDIIWTEWDYAKAARLQFIAGRSFNREYKTDSDAVILNEAALHVIGYKDPIGRIIHFNNRALTIIGVTQNVMMRDPFKPVGPAVILFGDNNTNDILVRLKDRADLKASIAAIGPVVERYNPALPFDYNFVDKAFAKKFEIEEQVAKLAAIFACLAIFISCLGLFGLAMFMAERRSKEVSIRKVLGAPVAGLCLLLSKEFIWLVTLACVIASPLVYWLMNNWLENYEYRVVIHWWIFALAGMSAILIALLTVSIQTIRVVTDNPVKSLKAD